MIFEILKEKSIPLTRGVIEKEIIRIEKIDFVTDSIKKKVQRNINAELAEGKIIRLIGYKTDHHNRWSNKKMTYPSPTTYFALPEWSERSRLWIKQGITPQGDVDPNSFVVINEVCGITISHSTQLGLSFMVDKTINMESI